MNRPVNIPNHSHTLPTGVSTITKSMLDEIRDQDQIKYVIIPQGVNSIEKEAFFGCTSLTSITIPDSIKKIGEDAFNGCKNLTSITIPKHVTVIEPAAFRKCTNLTSITIPDSVTEIEPAAFNYCSSLTSINIPDSVTSIRQDTFFGCTGLTSITIPNSVTTIEGGVFEGCTSLTSITIPNSIKKIGTLAFKHCTFLASITIPDGVTSHANFDHPITGGVFEGCTSLTSITIPNSVTSIGSCAFKKCTNLTSITIPNSVTSIDPEAFENCANLQFVIISSNLESKNANYWYNKGIDLKQTTLITRNELSTWASSQELSSTYSYQELAILYQLQKDDNFILSWQELGKIGENLSMNDLLRILPKEKTNMVLPKIYTSQPSRVCLENHSLFNVTATVLRQEESDYLKKEGFREYKNPNGPTKTVQLREVNPAASRAILKWLTLKEVATLLSIKASSELKPIHTTKEDSLATHNTRPVMQG